MNEFARLQSGVRVSDVGNVPLGTVGRVTDRAFELVPDQGRGPIWLSPEALYIVQEQAATLICARANLAAYRIPPQR